MQRQYTRGLIICLIPTLVALYFCVFGEYKKGIDLAGGTILVFEVDKDKTNERLKSEGSMAGFGQSNEDLKKLAENIKRRIDPVDTRGVIVRPVGNDRIEILLPFSDSKKKGSGETITEDYVQFVKNIVAQAGVLDFRILANRFDDATGIRAAEEKIASLGPEGLAALAKAGKAPPGPDSEYPVTAAGDSEVNVRYVWVEVGKEERESLRLSNKNAGTSILHAQLANQRNAVYSHDVNGGRDDATLAGNMQIFSRECIDERLKPAEREEKKVEYFLLTRVSPKDKLLVGGAVSLTASVEQGASMRPEVGFRFNSAGATKFGEITGRNKKTNVLRNLAVVLDGRVVSAPTLNAVITSAGSISGESMREKEVNQLVYILRSGALNAELKPQPVSENSVGATLGADTIRKGLWAVGLSFAAVMVFMCIYYRFVGLVACIALVVNLLLTVGFMIGVNAAFTLAGLAGIVLMLGMAVDANVLIYERMREERERGASLAAAVRNGYDRSLATILDTHITSILTAVVLFAFGNDNLKGFAVSLILGLVISLFTALYVTRLIIDYSMSRRWFTTFKPMQLFARPNFNPMKWRFHFFTATTILTVLGLALFLMRGEKVLNVDFTRGTSYTARLVDGLPLSGSDGKPGLLNLISEDNQKKRLALKSVVDPNTAMKGVDGQDKASDEKTYKLTFADGFETTVTLANKPSPTSASSLYEFLQAAKAGKTASLPLSLGEASVETLKLDKLDDDLPSGTARSFTVRTTEQEKALVEVMLDRLLRDDSGKPLLAMNKLAETKLAGTAATLTFDKPISPESVKGMLARSFEIGNIANPAGESFELVPVPAADGSAERLQETRDGKFRTLTVDISKNPEFNKLAIAAPAIGFAGSASSVGILDAADRQTALLSNALKRTQDAFASTPVPDSVQTFDPALAADTRNKAFYAILGSWLIILAYLWFRFGNWTFGLAAVLCLIHDLCFTLGAIAICHYLHAIPGMGLLGIQDFKIDLATVAALLTLVGYSVNDTIVVFDRIREVRGKNPLLTPQMINDSVNQTLSRTVLASLTVFLVVGVLYFFGGNGVHLFAFVMVVGVIVGTYSSIFVASPLLLLFGEGKAVPKVFGGANPTPDELAPAPSADKPMAL